MKVVMIVSNPMMNDSRVEKEAQALVECGYQVEVVARNHSSYPNLESREGYQIHRVADDTSVTSVYSLLLNLIRLFIRSLRALYHSKKLMSRSLASQNGKQSSIGRKRLESERKNQVNWFASFARKVNYHLTLELVHRMFAAQVKTVLDRIGWDVLHFHDLDSTFVLRLLRNSKVSYIYDSHELWVHRNRGPIGRPLSLTLKSEEKWERCVIRNAKATLTVCDSIADYLESQYKAPKPTVIRNVPSALKGVSANSRNFRSDLGLSNETQVVVYTGRITYNRGIEGVIEAFRTLSKKISFVMIGPWDQSYLRYFNSKFRGIDQLESVYSLDPVSSKEVSGYIRTADLAIVPIAGEICLSYELCLPNKLFEAIQAKLPVLVSNLPELRRVVEDYNCGEVIVSHKPTELASQLKRVLGDTSLLERYSFGAERAATELVWESEKHKLLDLYGSLLN